MAKKINIGGQLHSTATGNTVAGAEEILDSTNYGSGGKKQNVVNAETNAHLNTLDERASTSELDIEDLEERVHAVEEHESIVIQGGELEVVNTPDDIKEGSGAVATANGLANAYGYMVENPEWIRVVTDRNGRILAGIKTDGSIEWSLGIPTPIQEAFESIAESMLTIISGSDSDALDGVYPISRFLRDYDRNDTLADVLDGLLIQKVDKVEGKSLIDEDFANGISYVENPEFAEVKTDHEDKIIEAVKLDGTKYFGGNVENNAAIVSAVSNPEFVKVWLDREDRILFAIKSDGDIMFGCGVPSQVVTYISDKIAELHLTDVSDIITFLGDLYTGDETLQQLLDKKVDGEYVENPEFIRVVTDNEDKILEGTKADGTKIIESNLEVKGTVNGVDVEDVANDVSSLNSIVPNKVDKVEGKSLIDSEYASSMSVIENPEYIDVELDSENRIIGGRKINGEKFDNIGIRTPLLKMPESGLKELALDMNIITNSKQTKIFGFDDFSGTGWSSIDSGKAYYTESTNYLLYSTDIQSWKFALTACLHPTGSTYEVGLGKYRNQAGTIFTLCKTASASELKVYLVNESGNLELKKTLSLTNITLNSNEDYYVTIVKRITNRIVYDVTVTDMEGHVDIFEDAGGTSFVGHAWGKIAFVKISGDSLSVSNCSLGFDVDTDLRCIALGHSYIEGGSIPSYLDESFIGLTFADIGEKKTINLGRGGESTTGILANIDKIIKWFSNAQYAIVNIGGNDFFYYPTSTNIANCITNMQAIKEKLINANITPVWICDPGWLENTPTQMQPYWDWILAQDHYVDIRSAFKRETSYYLSDGVHPSVATHRLIYSCIKAQAAFMFD